jgi:alpha-amylase/alpha-mannosidase (GH57 family)
MKIIFLDVDGVLNTPKTIKKFGFDFIDNILVALVARIVRETEAKIVLSSTWRVQEKDKNIVIQALSQHGLELFDCTPVIERSGGWTEGGWVRRNEEIQAWLNNNQAQKFAILDDFDDACIEGSFFQTDENIGLTVPITEKIIEHLK